MSLIATLPTLDALFSGSAIFSDNMPVWFGVFGSDVWPIVRPTKNSGPAGGSTNEMRETTASAIMWRDYMRGRGATNGHPNSIHRSKYTYCLTPEMVRDLKIAAVIHGFFPGILKHARRSRKKIDAKTVKGRIEELARIFSAAMIRARKQDLPNISRLQDIPLSLLKECIAEHPGRGSHLKRALKLISHPVVQQNLAGHLKWKLVDIEKSSIAWPESTSGTGILTLPDPYFLFIQDHCIKSICDFKICVGLEVHCQEMRTLMPRERRKLESSRAPVLEYLAKNPSGAEEREIFKSRFKLTAHDVEQLIVDAQCSSIMLILLMSGMRSSETRFVFADALYEEHGYWFIRSKVVKGRKKDQPVCEGWLAIDIVRDAYDILEFFCGFTGNKHLISSPFSRFPEGVGGYAENVLGTKLSRWLEKIDSKGLFADWTFSPHQCRETLVSQLAKQEVGLPFISMQLKHFSRRFNGMPNGVTAGYGNYRSSLMTAVANRMAWAKEVALTDLYGEDARFAGGGGEAHKTRVDAFFAGMGLFGERRVAYIKALANRGVKIQPTSIGGCTRNFELPVEDKAPPCYGDYECDPDCDSHVITERGGIVLAARREHALGQAEKEINPQYKVIWLGLARRQERHIAKLKDGELRDN